MSKKITLKYSGLGPVSMPAGKTVGGVITIKPGVCELTDLEWAIMKNQPDIKDMLERGKKFGAGENTHDKKTGMGNLIIVGDGKEASNDSDNDNGSIEGNVPGNQNVAKKLVAETEDTGLLEKWLEKESRAGVKNAIEKQLKSIEDYRKEHGDKD